MTRTNHSKILYNHKTHHKCAFKTELKCRLTHREATSASTSTASSSLTSSSTSGNNKCSSTDNSTRDVSLHLHDSLSGFLLCYIIFFTKNFKIQHHWLLRKQENNENLDKKCTYCTKGFTNRFGLQTSSSRTLISCSWCKVVLHLKCYSSYINDHTNDCNLGEFYELIVPPHWIIKLARKNVSF
jgi:hypothetical protein